MKSPVLHRLTLTIAIFAALGAVSPPARADDVQDARTSGDWLRIAGNYQLQTANGKSAADCPASLSVSVGLYRPDEHQALWVPAYQILAEPSRGGHSPMAIDMLPVDMTRDEQADSDYRSDPIARRVMKGFFQDGALFLKTHYTQVDNCGFGPFCSTLGRADMLTALRKVAPDALQFYHTESSSDGGEVAMNCRYGK